MNDVNPAAPPAPRRGWGMGNTVRYALSDLRHRRGTTALNVAAVALAGVYVLVFGFYGERVFRHQQAVVDGATPTKVVALTADVTDRAARFTDERIHAVAAAVGATTARPHVEMTVRLSLGASALEGVTAEGVLPQEPLVGRSALASGEGLADGHDVVLGGALFAKLGGDAAAGPGQRLTLEVGRTVEGREEVCRVALRLAGLLRSDPADERIFVPLALARSLDLWATAKIASLAGGDAPPGRSYASCDAYVPPEQLERAIADAAAMRLIAEPAETFDAADAAGPVTSRLVAARDGAPVAPDERLAARLNAAALAGVPAPATAPATRGAANDAVPYLTFEDARGYLQARRTAGELGYRLVPREYVSVGRLTRIRVRDARAGDGRVDASLVGLLALSRPTFADCRGRETLDAEVPSLDASLTLVTSAPDDPARFARRLADGRWLSDPTDAAVVLPASIASRPGRPSVAPGERIVLRLRRTNAARGGREELALPLRVVGISDGELGFADERLVLDLLGWQAGRLVYNDTRARFESPREVAEQAGQVRAAFYAPDIDALPQVVRALQRLGYRTQDRLAEQQALGRLQQALILIGGGSVGGYLIFSAAFIAMATSLNYRSKGYEIAILRAHGVRPRDVLRMFAVQGLVIAGAATLLAAAAAAVAGPAGVAVLSRGVSPAAGAVLAGSPLEPRMWWLWLVAAGVSVVFSLLGVLLPGYRACRRPVLGDLRHRD